MWGKETFQVNIEHERATKHHFEKMAKVCPLSYKKLTIIYSK